MSHVYYELKKVRNGHFLFKLRGSAGEIIFFSEVYSSKASAEHAISYVRYSAPDETTYELRHDSHERPYFILKSKDEQIIGHSDPYSCESAARKAIKTAMQCAVTPEIKDLTR
ncbi:YegP family protein [Biostraticola tofi]|uniref:DUF1508 domain-containing protein n=1 Tax=Biostraticola tofi TaxID=466109 RepID=A0A4V2W3H1_9GAMM|nr:YegP family protein [Biostraticola tofi]TCV91919.1 hypothetical protein EDC52_11426 [Biostraticola tofi]